MEHLGNQNFVDGHLTYQEDRYIFSDEFYKVRIKLLYSCFPIFQIVHGFDSPPQTA